VTKGTDARLSFSTGIRAAARASDRAYGPEVKGTAAEKIGDARSGRHPRLKWTVVESRTSGFGLFPHGARLSHSSVEVPG